MRNKNFVRVKAKTTRNEYERTKHQNSYSASIGPGTVVPGQKKTSPICFADPRIVFVVAPHLSKERH
jgi:hypothetical protein